MLDSALEAIPHWLLLTLGVLADLALLYSGIRLVKRIRRRRTSRQDDAQ